MNKVNELSITWVGRPGDDLITVLSTLKDRGVEGYTTVLSWTDKFASEDVTVHAAFTRAEDAEAYKNEYQGTFAIKELDHPYTLIISPRRNQF